MNPESFFKKDDTIRIWYLYFDKVERILRMMDDEQKNDIILEIQGHLLDSFNQDEATQEADRLLNAQERLGDPAQFLKPLMADRLLDQASQTFNPKTIVRGLYYSLYGGLRRVTVALCFFLGYAIAVLFAVIAVLKPIFPSNVGLMLNESDEWVLGVTSSPKVDLLGLWTIPISLVLFGLSYYGLSKMLKYRKDKNQSQ